MPRGLEGTASNPPIPVRAIDASNLPAISDGVPCFPSSVIHRNGSEPAAGFKAMHTVPSARASVGRRALEDTG